MSVSLDRTVVSLGKEKCRLIGKGWETMKQSGYTYGIVPLTTVLLHEFSLLYKSYISAKNNAHVVDVYNYYLSRIETDTLSLAYIRDTDSRLLVAGIFIHKIIGGKKTYILCFRAKIQNALFGKLDMGYYIEYLFLTHGLSLSVDQFSRGRDRNGYGLLGAAIGLCIHKLQLHFLPYVSNKGVQVVLDEKNITRSCLFMTEPNDQKQFTHAVVYVTQQDREKYNDYIRILQKRGLVVETYYID